MEVKTLVKITLGFSIGLMLFAVTQDAYCTVEGCMHSMIAFVLGIFGMFIGGNETLTWFANPLLILAWALVKYHKVSLLLSLLSTLTALAFLMFDEVVINEAGHSSIITSYDVGYWLWIASHAVMLLGNGVIVFNKHSDAATNVEVLDD